MNTILAILNTFNSAVPIWAVMMFVILIYIMLDIRYIRRDLSNHITDTNKKIDDLQLSTNNKIEKLDQKIDNLNNRFDKLYQILLKDKQSSK